MNTLLLTQDVQAASKLAQVLQQQNIEIVICQDSSDASRHLQKAKYHALFLDCDAPHAIELLDALKHSRSNKTAVVLAISGDNTIVHNGDVRTQAQFVLQKPLEKSQIEKTLRAARGLLLRELRQYYRLSLDAPIAIGFGGKTLQAKTTNISLGGVVPRKRSNPRPRFMFACTCREVNCSKHLPRSFGLTGRGERESTFVILHLCSRLVLNSGLRWKWISS